MTKELIIAALAILFTLYSAHQLNNKKSILRAVWFIIGLISFVLWSWSALNSLGIWFWVIGSVVAVILSFQMGKISKFNFNLKYVIFLVVSVFLVTTVYWGQARPYLASKSCHRIALEDTGYNGSNENLWVTNDSAQRDYMFIYEVCMHKEGLNP